VKNKFIKIFIALCTAAMLMLPLSACSSMPSKASKSIEIEAGATWELAETTHLSELTLGNGATVTARKGYSVTLTVNGVETGIAAGTYTGDVVLTVTEANPIAFQKTTIHPFRQALYLDENGVVDTKSVLAAAGGYAVDGGTLTGAKIVSRGENFNGIYVSGGTHTIKDAEIDFTGNGGNDFAGYGAAIMTDGPGTTLVLDNAKISTQGAVRTAFVSHNTSSLIVKNATVVSKEGVLPDTYVPNVTPGRMMGAPWMLGIAGNCRATNLLGSGTVATYLNSDIAAEGWGALSVDESSNTKLTAINTKIAVTGTSGYATYAIGNSTNAFYGCDITVPDYAAINRGGLVIFGASTPERVATLNADLKLGLTADELNALEPARTIVNSKRFGVMWHGQGNVQIQDDTIINTGKAIFLDKGQTANIKVDGSKGAQLNSANGVILQIIEDDDPGPVMENGTMVNKGVYTESDEIPAKAQDWDITAATGSDIIATFTNITLKGDFYNAIKGSSIAGADKGLQAGGMGAGAPGGSQAGPGGPPGPPPGSPNGGPPGPPPGGTMPMGGIPGGPAASGKNMVLTFENTNITGVITASQARHAKSSITAEDYKLLGEVTNTPGPAVNNGVIVSLDDRSTWTVTGTSYVTSLTIAGGATLAAPEGRKVTMTVDGEETAVEAGTYKGDIVISVTGASSGQTL
jgi:hypothetical protein